MQGRYVCSAASGAVQYAITFDLLCRNLADAGCIRLVRVADGRGKTLYGADR
jgi:hypothetical protein